MSDIDYRKLLKLCLIKWIEEEGGCWGGGSFETIDPNVDYELSPEETKAIQEVIKEIDTAKRNSESYKQKAELHRLKFGEEPVVCSCELFETCDKCRGTSRDMSTMQGDDKMSSNTKYPSFNKYSGGGTILNWATSEKNIVYYCQTPELLNQVRDLISEGYEVMLLDGQIKAVQKCSM